MPVIDNSQFWSFCDLDYDGPTMGDPYDLGGKREYTTRHKVGIKVKEMGPWAVSLCPLLPLPGSPYKLTSPIGVIEYDTQCLLVHRHAERMEKGDWQTWIVEDKYSTELPSSSGRTDNPQKSSEDPTYDLADISWDFETIQEAPERDLNGVCFLTTAQMPMSPPPTFPLDCPVVHISRNELNFNHQLASYYSRGLNDARFLLAPTGCVQVMPPSAVQKNRGGFRYWRTSYKLVFRPPQKDGGYILPTTNFILPFYDSSTGKFLGYRWENGKNDLVDSWQPRVLMQGMYRLGTANDMEGLLGKPIPIFKLGHQVNHNVLLDQFGQESKALNPAVDPTIPAWYKEFVRFRYVNIVKLLLKGLS